MIPLRQDPLADLAETVGNALLVFAERLRTEPAAEATGEPEVADNGAPNRAKLGGTQARILEALEAAGEAGLTAGQVAEKVGVAATNAPRALRALQARALVSASDESPTIWRIAQDV